MFLRKGLCSFSLQKGPTLRAAFLGLRTQSLEEIEKRFFISSSSNWRTMVATPGQQETGETLLTEPVISLKRKMGKKVGTHNGTFHCDEVLGCFMIRLTKKFEEAEIIRSRDQKVRFSEILEHYLNNWSAKCLGFPLTGSRLFEVSGFFSCVKVTWDFSRTFGEFFQVLDTMDAVLDVGGIYDPATDRYDHHQRGFEQAFGHGFVTKLSSAGLVYKVCYCLHLQTLNPQPHLCYFVSTTSPPCATGNHQLRLTQRFPCSIMGKKS